MQSPLKFCFILGTLERTRLTLIYATFNQEQHFLFQEVILHETRRSSTKYCVCSHILLHSVAHIGFEEVPPIPQHPIEQQIHFRICLQLVQVGPGQEYDGPIRGVLMPMA